MEFHWLERLYRALSDTSTDLCGDIQNTLIVFRLTFPDTQSEASKIQAVNLHVQSLFDCLMIPLDQDQIHCRRKSIR